MLERLQELLKTTKEFETLIKYTYDTYCSSVLDDPECLPGLPMTLFTMYFHSVYVGRHALDEMVKLVEASVPAVEKKEVEEVVEEQTPPEETKNEDENSTKPE